MDRLVLTILIIIGLVVQPVIVSASVSPLGMQNYSSSAVNADGDRALSVVSHDMSEMKAGEKCHAMTGSTSDADKEKCSSCDMPQCASICISSSSSGATLLSSANLQKVIYSSFESKERRTGNPMIGAITPIYHPPIFV